MSGDSNAKHVLEAALRASKPEIVVVARPTFFRWFVRDMWAWLFAVVFFCPVVFWLFDAVMWMLFFAPISAVALIPAWLYGRRIRRLIWSERIQLGVLMPSDSKHVSYVVPVGEEWVGGRESGYLPLSHKHPFVAVVMDPRNAKRMKLAHSLGFNIEYVWPKKEKKEEK